MARLQVKGWSDFQHYKDRAPPWIKLHKSLLDNYDFQMLHIASRALAPMFWLLASESSDGSFDADPVKLAFRLRTTEKIVSAALDELISKGFLVSDSVVLAHCKRDAIPETETETEERQRKALSGKPDADPPKQKFKEQAIRVIDFLNSKTGKAFQHAPVNVDMISARLREGATEQDCKSVIARKTREWLNDEKMREYLRPGTLFNREKFAQYVGELVVSPEHQGALQ